jgi:hypothetical protein
VGYGPFSLCVIHKEGQYPSSRGIKRLMMMMIIRVYTYHSTVDPGYTADTVCG